jgi:hypothetical protein
MTTNYRNVDLQFPYSGVFDLGRNTFLGAVCRSLTPSLALRGQPRTASKEY